MFIKHVNPYQHDTPLPTLDQIKPATIIRESLLTYAANQKERFNA